MLSRGSQRPPTLTEELERLEQQITLTYQEIDHNFNKAHRIVTGQILPIVERYAKESTQLWNGAAVCGQTLDRRGHVAEIDIVLENIL